MKTKDCSDPTHKPHAGLAGTNAKLLNALQWAMQHLDPLASFVDIEEYKRYYRLAWGVDPIIKEEKDEEDLP